LIVEVATSKGVTISAPSDGFVSFFNSPYHPHIKQAASTYLEPFFGICGVIGGDGVG